MKFGKLLSVACEGNPQLSPLVLRYKKLKKLLKAVHAQQGQQQAAAEDGTSASQIQLSAEHLEFMNTISEDLARFNSYFIDKEEDAVILMEELSQRVQCSEELDQDQLQELQRELVELHGDLVLCLHWSLLNYAAVLKILKKHDKLGSLQLKPTLQAVILRQPFSSTKIMQQLAVQAEQMTTQVAQQQKLLKRAAGQAAEVEPEGLCEQRSLSSLAGDSSIFKHTQQALEMWATMRDTSSTPSTILPSALLQNLQHNLAVVYTQSGAGDADHASPAAGLSTSSLVEPSITNGVAAPNSRPDSGSMDVVSPFAKRTQESLAVGEGVEEEDRPSKRLATQLQQQQLEGA